MVTTHSSHILYERGFTPIRYFRRGTVDRRQLTDVVNLFRFYAEAPKSDRDFLARYLKLTHCDIFFADAAILVEGNIERLLLPLMIDKAAPRLNSCYLSVLEVGGAFGFKFKRLIEFLGITTLLITDIDSVEPDVCDTKGKKIGGGGGCKVDFPGAVPSNQTLIQWLPGKTTIAELIAVSTDERTQLPNENSQATVHVVYQTATSTRWNQNGQVDAEALEVIGRTLEESFALQNLEWCQDKKAQGSGTPNPEGRGKTAH